MKLVFHFVVCFLTKMVDKKIKGKIKNVQFEKYRITVLYSNYYSLLISGGSLY